MEGGVDEALEAVALGVGEVERPGVAVRDGDHRVDPGGGEALADGPEVVERGGPEGQVVGHHERARRRLGGCHEHDLVVCGGVLRDEGHLAHAGDGLATVRHREAEDLGVEAEHGLEVAHGEGDVGQGQSGGGGAAHE